MLVRPAFWLLLWAASWHSWVPQGAALCTCAGTGGLPRHRAAGRSQEHPLEQAFVSMAPILSPRGARRLPSHPDTIQGQRWGQDRGGLGSAANKGVSACQGQEPEALPLSLSWDSKGPWGLSALITHLHPALGIAGLPTGPALGFSRAPVVWCQKA